MPAGRRFLATPPALPPHSAPLPRQWLLLCQDQAWPGAVQQELNRQGGGTLQVAASPQDAMRRLIRPEHLISHFLLEPSAAGPFLRDLLGVTAGEAGSDVDLVLIGDVGLMTGSGALRQARTPDNLAFLLEGEAKPAGARPALSTSEIAVSFRPEDLECRFQPIVRLENRQPVGMETLVRLQHPERGTVGPDQFIPQIERGGLSLRLTEAVARAAMNEVPASLLEAHDLFITVNLPLDVLLFPESLQRIEAHRLLSGIPVARILVELTESRPVIDMASLAAAMERWRHTGYRVAIDDMGPEMFNQIALFDLPFNVVKLDKRIVGRAGSDQLALRYLQRTVDNAHARSLNVIAEGIENEAMWNHMRELGVDDAQGFLIARALPASALPAWLTAWSARPALPPDRSPGQRFSG